MIIFFSQFFYCVCSRTLHEKNIFPRLLFQWKEDEKLGIEASKGRQKQFLKLLTKSIEH